MEINLSDDEIMGCEKSFLKCRSNGLMLSDNDIDILKRNNIDYLAYSNLSSLVFAIEEALCEEELNTRLGEHHYYNYTNK